MCGGRVVGKVGAGLVLLGFMALLAVLLFEIGHGMLWPVAWAGTMWPFVPRFGAGFLWVLAVPGLTVLRHPELERMRNGPPKTLVTALAALAALIPLILRAGNGAFDTSPLEVRPVEVVAMTPPCWPFRRSRLWLDDGWDEGTLGIAVQRSTWQDCRVGDTVHLTTRDGSLGFDWVVAVSTCTRGTP